MHKISCAQKICGSEKKSHRCNNHSARNIVENMPLPLHKTIRLAGLSLLYGDISEVSVRKELCLRSHKRYCSSDFHGSKFFKKRPQI